MSPMRERRSSRQTRNAEFPSTVFQTPLSGLETEHRPDERYLSRRQDDETVIPVLLRDTHSTSEEGNFGHWILRPEEDEQSDSINSEDEEAAELSLDEGFWNMSRIADTRPFVPSRADMTLTNRTRGVLNRITTTAMDHLSTPSSTEEKELTFDDEDVVMVDGDEEEKDQDPEVPQFDFDVPFGPQIHESYRFEIDHPAVAPVIRYLNSIPAARHLAVVGREIHQNSIAGFNTAYGRLTETYGMAAQNIRPALRIGRQVANDVVEGALELRNAAQQQWREWSPWLDQMIETTMTSPTNVRRVRR